LLSWSGAVSALGMLTAVIAFAGRPSPRGRHPGTPQGATASVSPAAER